MDILDKIDQLVKENAVIIFMKGTPEQPECGFSAAAVKSLSATGLPFSFVNILTAPRIRERLPKYSQWPTFPQIFIGGELVGGCDIVLDMVQQETLKPAMQSAIESQPPQAAAS